MLNFDLPTLVTLTAPTCAGKSYLLEAMITELGFNRIVGTTDRPPRNGEVQGVHYDFLSTEQAISMTAAGEFAEHVQYNGVRYGVTHAEMAEKMAAGRPPMVILEPSGVELYRKYCSTHGWRLFTIFIDTQERIRLDRLSERTSSDIIRALSAGAETSHMDEVKRIVAANNKRLTAVIEQERLWLHTNTWDCKTTGTDTKKALTAIKQGVKNRNSRSDIYR